MIVEMDATALCARLDSMSSDLGEDALLAFDADGTIWDGDVTRDLVSFVMSERPLLSDGLSALRAVAIRYGVPLSDEPHDQLGGILLSYAEQQLPEAEAVRSVLHSFAGLDEQSYIDLVSQAISRSHLESRFHPAVGDVIDWASRRNALVVVVSASPRAAVDCAVRRLGLPVESVLGAEPSIVGGRLAAELAAPVLVGEGKVLALRAYTDRPVLAAFGDDIRDLPLLSNSRVPVAVRATRALLSLGQSGELRGLTLLSMDT
jgi:phosphoserine phosphatase